VKDVRVVDPAKGTRPAALQQTIKGDLAVRTGAGSRAELLFSDNTLTRLGADTFFSFTGGTRDMSLERGTMLLQVPKGQGGARIRTAAVTASITGTTILLEHTAQRAVKVVVLEGSLRLAINNALGQSTLLTAGKMVIMPSNARQIPDPVDVDLQKLVSSSGLVKMTGKSGAGESETVPLPSAQLVEKEIGRQAKFKARGQLAATNLEIRGNGTAVEVTTDLDQQMQANTANRGLAAEENRSNTRGKSGSRENSAEGRGGGKGQRPDRPTLPEPPRSPKPPKPPKPDNHPTIVVDSTILAENLGQGGKDPDASRAGDLKIEGKRRSGLAIHVTSTGELLSLLRGAKQGGRIELNANGGAILVDGSKIVAEQGTVELLNRGQSGVVTLQNATISGDVVKIGALGRNGQLLIGGGTLSADTTLKLYATGSNGSVRFLEDTTLGGAGAKLIAGREVTIDNGRTVNVAGSQAARVFTDRPNYTGSGGNGSTTGQFSGAGATTSSRKDAPGF
jgi:hypothetical protein